MLATVTADSGPSAGDRVRQVLLSLSSYSQGRRPFDLDWLLHPIAKEDFFRAHWESEPLLINREDRNYFAGLPGLDAVDELIASTPVAWTRPGNGGRMVRTDRDGTTSIRYFQLNASGIPDIQDVYRAYENGYTIVVNRIHHRSAPVALLCHTLESALHHPVGVNLYLTPRGGQGLGVHVDTHDVFILQLHGNKEWRIAAPPKSLPLVSTKRDKLESILDFRAYTLNPGDVLYLPRGFPHEAMTASSSSLHLTVGIYLYRWVDLLSEALRLVAEDRAEFRNALPPGFLDAPTDTAYLSKLTGQLASALMEQSLMERIKECLGSGLLQTAKAPTGAGFRSVDAISNLTPESVAIRAPGLFCRVRSNSTEAIIEFPANFVAGPALIEPALRFIAEHERFVIRELPGKLPTEDKIDLVARLVTEGLLNCSTNTMEAGSDDR